MDLGTRKCQSREGWRIGSLPYRRWIWNKRWKDWAGGVRTFQFRLRKGSGWLWHDLLLESLLSVEQQQCSWRGYWPGKRLECVQSRKLLLLIVDIYQPRTRGVSWELSESSSWKGVNRRGVDRMFRCYFLLLGALWNFRIVLQVPDSECSYHSELPVFQPPRCWKPKREEPANALKKAKNARRSSSFIPWGCVQTLKTHTNKHGNRTRPCFRRASRTNPIDSGVAGDRRVPTVCKYT